MTGSANHRVVGAILRRQDRILLCHRSPDREWFPNVWDVPGGHIEANESADDALVRELQEELAIELASALGQPFRTLTDAATNLEMTVWVVDYDGPIVNRAPEEHDEVRWVDASEVARLDLAHPDYVEMLIAALHLGRD